MNYPFGRNLLLNSVGFERLLSAFGDIENATAENKTPSYPPYNIIKTGEHDYAVELAVAGFKRDELEITFEGDKLTVTGKVKESREGEYLHRGIATRDFAHQFTLAETVLVKSADLVDGLLVIRLQNIIPEEKKPRKIAIGGQQEPLLVEDRQAA
ncbi:Hsp20 family protein [Orrella marina]|uniref:Molecular chaperone Hsp20 n=1 Tax=Orrella marina TaxID=2163011 RepID=A0A2R4XMD9_9BURK|nr:Hsp20 family protein [Orrella marina]AWB34955.1 molecular chaperone Hsp20 [Orrella marina]